MDDGPGLTQGRIQVMTRETKIGLLLGMGVILLIGIIISDQLSQPQQNPADFTGFATDAQLSIDTSDAAPGYRVAPGTSRAPGIPGSPGSPGSANLNATRDGQPAGTSPVNDPPSDFFIPDDIQPLPLTPRQADRTPGASPGLPNRSLPAYNVSEAPPAAQNPQDIGVPTLRVGNGLAELPHSTSTPTPVTRAGGLPAPQGGESAIRHTVLKGETLTKIARRYYGNGDYWRAIAQANPGKVTRDGQVREGVVLDIPKRADAALGAGLVTVGSERTIRVDTRTVNRPGKSIEVVAGDTLSELASKHLGSASKWQELLEANRDQISDAQSLRVGMKLRLPGTADRAPAPRAAPRKERGGKTYTVRSGDNLTQIAEKTLGDGSRWDDVYQANRDRLKSPDRLVVGLELRIPG
jgi:nucleoid-associated protein YgaU